MLAHKGRLHYTRPVKNNAFLTLSSYLFFFLVGYFINIGGAVTSAVAQDFAADTATIGYCFSLFMLGRFIGIIVNGVFMKRPSVDKKYYVRMAPALILLALSGLWLSRGVAPFALFLLLAGIGIGGIYSTSNMILVDLYQGKRKAFHITMINFLYSVGGVSSPFIAGLMLKNGYSWKYAYALFAVLLIGAFLLTLRADYRVLYSERPREARDTGAMNAPLWFICASIVLYIMAEFSFTYWTPVYMREALGKDPLFAGAAVSAFWVAVLIGRFLASLALQRIRPRAYILATGLLGVASLLSLRTLRADTPLLIACFLSGLFLSGLFPAIFTLGTDMSESLKRSFPTFMMLSAATGSFLAMPVGSVVKGIVGVEQMLLIPALALGAMCLLIILSAAHTRRPARI
jgi:fucose permease